MSKGLNLVRARHLQPCILTRSAKGGSAQRLDGASFPLAGALDVNALVPATVAERLFIAASHGVDTPIFAYKSAPHGLSSYGSLCEEIARSRTLREVLDGATLGLSEYSDLRFRLNNETRSWLYIDESSSAAHTRWNLYWLRPMMEIVRLVAGPGWWPKTVLVPGNRPRDLRSFDVGARASLQFGSATLAIDVPEEYLDITLSRFAMPIISQTSGGQAPIPTDYLDAMRTVLRGCVGSQSLSIGIFADSFGMSVRSLQRELSQRGSSYTRLVREARFLSATSLLRDASRSITDIAYHVGYADPAHFTRAFSQLAGMPPLAYRRQKAAQEIRAA